MKSNFTEYHQLLNQKGSYPETYLRRNHIMFPLVCAINSIICFYISGNYEQIPLFVNRAYKHIIQYPYYKGDQETRIQVENYKKLVLAYLAEIAQFVIIQDIDLSKKEFIPKELLWQGAGKSAPSKSQQHSETLQIPAK